MAITKNSQIDLNGNEMILDADGDTTITADTDDQIDIKVAGSDKVQINATGLGIGQVPTRDLSLHAGDASSVFAHFTNTDTGTTSSDGLLIGLGSSEDLVLNNQESSKNIIIENGGSERMRIDSSGNVGIGTTSPNTALHTASGSNSSGLVDVARFQNVGTSVDDGARIQLTSGTSTSGAGIGCLGYALNSAHLVFHSGGNNERMRIDQAGNVGIGTTGPSGRLHIKNVAGTSASDFVTVEGDTSDNNNYPRMEFKGGTLADNFPAYGLTNGGLASYIQSGYHSTNYNNRSAVACNGGDGSVQFYSGTGGSQTLNAYLHGNGDFYTNDGTVSSIASDIRVKSEIVNLTDGLDIVNKLRPVTYKYNEKLEHYSPQDATTTRYGLIADEVKLIAPQYITEGTGKVDGVDVDDFKTLSTTKMIPMLIKAIQEQQAQIEALQSEINTLKGG